MERPQARTVLLVEQEAGERSLLGRWLEEAGFGVETCPGPTGPDYTCIGGRGGRCPLAIGADVVVLDLRLASDIAMTGTPGWHLLTYYIELGKPVVALVGSEDSVRPREDDRIRLVSRPPSREDVIEAVGSLARTSTRARS